jgi:hemerythrin superfamily protein
LRRSIALATAKQDKSDILVILKDEHDEVKQLFKDYMKEAEKDEMAGKETVDKILSELTRHAEMEEQIVYPALEEADEDLYHEAHEEHHVAELLMAEIGGMKPGPVFKAKVTVLQENVEHHIDEEEKEGFKVLRKVAAEKRSEMGEQWMSTKESWKPAATATRRAS